MANVELKSITVVAPKTGSYGQNEKEADRLKRMKAFWADRGNLILHPVGRLLAVEVNGTRLADMLAKGDAITGMTDITVNGVSLPLVTGFVLSMGNLKNWACPACRSAHGSGTAPSRLLEADGLAKNRFYYRPADKALFVISDTCMVKYCAEILGKAKVPQVFTVPQPGKA